jgi:hypothetical protein
MAANGFPVRLTIFPNLDHNYGAVADAVNADGMEFLQLLATIDLTKFSDT